jgi:hypothetical protein
MKWVATGTRRKYIFARSQVLSTAAPQGLKPASFGDFTAQLKSCPDTKHFLKLARNKLTPTFVLRVSIAACLVLLFPVNAFAAKYRTQRWRAVEIVLTSSVTYDNPFQDVDVTATFAGPDHTLMSRPAFWDGGRTWKVRFAPPHTGVWEMTTSATDPKNKGLDGVTASVRCDPYSGTLEIYKRGFLKVSANSRYFVYADGTPFFYLGDTHTTRQPSKGGLLPHRISLTAMLTIIPSCLTWRIRIIRRPRIPGGPASRIIAAGPCSGRASWPIRTLPKDSGTLLPSSPRCFTRARMTTSGPIRGQRLGRLTSLFNTACTDMVTERTASGTIFIQSRTRLAISELPMRCPAITCGGAMGLIYTREISSRTLSISTRVSSGGSWFHGSMIRRGGRSPICPGRSSPPTGKIGSLFSSSEAANRRAH